MSSGFAPAEGASLYYEVAGDGSPIVLLQPGGGVAYWDRQMPDFSREHRVIRFDPRGFGRSERPDVEYSLYEDMRAVLDAVGVERVAGVGLSYGGRTLIDFALAYPERLSKMVLVNPGVSGYDWPGLADYFAALADAVRRNDLDAYVEAILRTNVDGPYRTPDQVDPAVRREIKMISTEQTARNRASGVKQRLRELNAITRLSEIRTPTLVVISALDQPDIHILGDRILAEVRGARRVVIEGVAHYVNLEKPREFSAAVLPFLADT